LKALSNQKFADFKARYGGDRVGLLTGDIAINRGAPITVMTTEVFRNMVYDPDSAKQLSDVFVVIFDEFHYMNDPDRGTVWEECVISCPSHIRMLALSATMGNVEDIKGWFEAVHGPTQLVVSTHRPVPLRYLFALKSGLMPLFRDPNSGPGAPNGVRKAEGKLHESSVINPSITKMEEQALKKSMTRATTSQPFRRPKPNPSALVPRFVDVTEDLHNLKLLPAIIFIFSRAGCEQAAKMITQSRTRLVSDEDARFVQQAINLFARNNPEIPIHRSTVNMLKAGVAVHHAGLIPVWKAFVEDLFNANKIKVLFATETLAAGVNMYCTVCTVQCGILIIGIFVGLRARPSSPA
jgi:superfamily II RNA helicase